MGQKEIEAVMLNRRLIFYVTPENTSISLQNVKIVDSDALWIPLPAGPTSLEQPLRGCSHSPQYYDYYNIENDRKKGGIFFTIGGEKWLSSVGKNS